MKLKLISLVLTAALALTACESKQPLVSDLSSKSSTQTRSQTKQETSQPTASESALPPAQADSSSPDLSYWEGWGHPCPDAAVNLLDSQGKVISPSTLIQGSQPAFMLYYKFGLDGFDGENVQLYLLASADGALCDFELAGEKSSSGMLCVSRQLGKEYKEPLKLLGCGLKNGSNKVGVYLLGFCSQVGKAQTVQLVREFTSDTDQQPEKILLPQRYDDVIKYGSADKSELSLSHNFEFDKGEYDEQRDLTTVPKGTKLYYRYINANDERTAARDADVLLIVLKNGKPMPLFSTADKAVLPLKNTDYSVLLPVDEMNGTGYAKYQVCLFEIGTENGYTDFGRLFYVK